MLILNTYFFHVERCGVKNHKSLSRAASLLKWERIAASAMSGSELDLELHYDNDHTNEETFGDLPVQTFV